VGLGFATGGLAGLLYGFALAGVKKPASGPKHFLAAMPLALPHTAGHLSVAYLTVRLATWWFPNTPLPLRYPGAFAALIILGTTVFATYLHLADLAGHHTLEAFSGMRIQGYKSHLRIKISENTLTVHVVGMKTVDPATPQVVDTFTITPRPPTTTTPHAPALNTEDNQGEPAALDVPALTPSPSTG
jgi:hypothetical protein